MIPNLFNTPVEFTTLSGEKYKVTPLGFEGMNTIAIHVQYLKYYNLMKAMPDAPIELIREISRECAMHPLTFNSDEVQNYLSSWDGKVLLMYAAIKQNHPELVKEEFFKHITDYDFQALDALIEARMEEAHTQQKKTLGLKQPRKKSTANGRA